MKVPFQWVDAGHVEKVGDQYELEADAHDGHLVGKIETSIYLWIEHQMETDSFTTPASSRPL